MAPPGGGLRSEAIRYGGSPFCHEKERDTLHRQGLEEIRSRETDERLVAWLQGGAEGDLSSDVPRHRRWPGVEGFTQYFKRTYDGE